MVDAASRAVGAGVLEIRSGEIGGGFAAINSRQKESRGAFEDGERSATEEIGKANVGDFLAVTDGQDEAAVMIELHVKARRAAVAIEASEHALEEICAAGDDGGMIGHSIFYFSK